MKKVTYQLSEIAKRTDAELHGQDCVIQGIATVQTATDGDISFIDNPHYRKFLPHTKASAVILTRDLLDVCPCSALVVNNPYYSYAKVAELFMPEVTHEAGIHSSAVVAESASIDKTAMIAANVVIGERVEIAANAKIGAGSVILDDSRVGQGTQLYPNVTLYSNVHLGERCIIHSGVVIGADGFGITKEEGAWIHVPQLAGVRIGNDVSVGANTTIDCGALEHTVISDGVKLDNQIQIGHNVTIGKNTAMAGCTAVAGSVSIGSDCLIGGAACFAGHLSVADNVSITGMSAVYASLTKPGVYSSGVPLQEHRQTRRSALRFTQLDKMAKRIKKLEKEIEKISQ